MKWQWHKLKRTDHKYQFVSVKWKWNVVQYVAVTNPYRTPVLKTSKPTLAHLASLISKLKTERIASAFYSCLKSKIIML